MTKHEMHATEVYERLLQNDIAKQTVTLTLRGGTVTPAGLWTVRGSNHTSTELLINGKPTPFTCTDVIDINPA